MSLTNTLDAVSKKIIWGSLVVLWQKTWLIIILFHIWLDAQWISWLINHTFNRWMNQPHLSWFRIMVFYATFNNISVISWWLFIIEDEVWFSHDKNIRLMSLLFLICLFVKNTLKCLFVFKKVYLCLKSILCV